MGIFRIAKAEFIKIFKKPSIYIMALVLLITILFSTTFFKPNKVSNYMVRDLGNTVSEIYTSYHDGDGQDTKANYQNLVYTALGKIEFYQNQNLRNDDITLKMLTLQDAYYLYYDIVQNDKTNTTALQSVKNSFIVALKDLQSSLGNFDHIDGMEYATFDLFTKYTNSSMYQTDMTTMSDFIAKSSMNDISYFNYLQQENFLEKMKTIASNHKDYIGITLSSYLIDYENKYAAFLNNLDQSSSTSTIQNAVINLIDSLRVMQEYYQTLFTTSPLLRDGQTTEKIPLILTTTKSYTAYNELFEEYQQVLSSGDTFEKFTEISATITKNNYHTQIQTIDSDYELVTIDQTQLVSLQEYMQKYVYPHIDAIIDDKTGTIYQMYIENPASSSLTDTQNILTEITKAKSVASNTNDYIQNQLIMMITNGKTDAEINTLYGFDFAQYSLYESQESSTRINYLLTNRKYDFEYDYAFADGQTSGTKTNAYDFVYYALKWSVLLVSIYVIAMASSSIATEQENGTIKLLLVRPYKRFKIITGKFLSIMSFAFIFMLFSLLASFFVGYGLYGLQSQTILTVFNANTAFTISPVGLMLLNFMFSFLEVLIYLCIAVMFATVFKSFASSFSVSLIVFVLLLFSNVLLGSTYVFGVLPFAHFNLYKFFGGVFRAGDVSGINSLFATHLIGVVHIGWAILYNAIIVLITSIITYVVFKHRDF